MTGKALAVGAWCSGVAPQEAMLERVTRPHPEPGLRLLVRAGSRNLERGKVVLELSPENDGSFRVNLPPGTYCVTEELYRTKAGFMAWLKEGGKVDAACAEARFAKCLAVWTLTAQTRTVPDVIIGRECDWSRQCTSGLPPPP